MMQPCTDCSERKGTPNSERTPYTQALSIAPSPPGQLLATVTVNQKDGEYDIVLLSTEDGRTKLETTARLGYERATTAGAMDPGLFMILLPASRKMTPA